MPQEFARSGDVFLSRKANAWLSADNTVVGPEKNDSVFVETRIFEFFDQVGCPSVHCSDQFILRFQSSRVTGVSAIFRERCELLGILTLVGTVLMSLTCIWNHWRCRIHDTR